MFRGTPGICLGDGRIDVAAAYRRLVPAAPSPNPQPPTAGMADRLRPQVSVIYPTNNMTVGGTVPVRVVATDNVGVARVELVVGRQLVATDNQAPFEFEWNTSGLVRGTLTAVRAKAYDWAGNVKTSKLVLVWAGDWTTSVAPVGSANPPAGDRIRPTVAITSPAAGSLLRGVVPIDVAASDNVGISHVELRVDKVPVAVDTSSPFGFAWNTATVAAGKHSLAVTAYDATGNAKLSRTVLVEVAF